LIPLSVRVQFELVEISNKFDVAYDAGQVAEHVHIEAQETHLGRLIKQVSEKGETYVLTKKGKPKIVLVRVEE
jgi:hypothetical protein